MTMYVKQIEAIGQVEEKAWNDLVGDDYPFIRHEFLSALENSGCVSADTGWRPMHLLVFDNAELIAGMPLYLKSHSRGEYVFDQRWAYAYERSGRRYFPKWLSAVPFTPCPGARFVVKCSADQERVLALLMSFVKEASADLQISSFHSLFPVDEQLAGLKRQGLLIREGVQFQWLNKDYSSFEDFLSSLSAGKRKMLKRERRKVVEQDLTLIRLPGREATDRQWRVFYDFYHATYLKHGMPPYLNLDFFQKCAQSMGEKMLLVFAVKEGEYVGGSLSFTGTETLYGRYWGCREEYDALHFEACYYQGVDYCIEHGLRRFDSGAQGEHKIARGFEPVLTYSAHWFPDENFAGAVQRFLAEEKTFIERYREEAAGLLPFKK